MIFNESLKNITSTWLTGTKLVKLNSVLFDVLVPKSGPASTSAGKKLQSANRVLYALNNAGEVRPSLLKAGFFPVWERVQYGELWNQYSIRLSYECMESVQNITACYEYLDNVLSAVIKTRAGKKALTGTEFEYLVK